MPKSPSTVAVRSLTLVVAFARHVFRPRSTLVDVERDRDQALQAVGELSSRTDTLEEQLDKLGRLLKQAEERTAEKAKQLEHVEARLWSHCRSHRIRDEMTAQQVLGHKKTTQ